VDTQGSQTIRNNYRTMHDLVFNTLMEDILSGRLKPGEKLNISEISEHLEVSRTPVREALKQLMSVGLVENVPHRSPFVKKLSIEEIIELYYIRAALEGVASRLASKRLSDKQIRELERLCKRMEEKVHRGKYDDFIEDNSKFHFLIYAAADSPRLQEMALHYYRQCEQYRALVMELPGSYNDACQEHRNILNAFKQRDLEKADNFARQHYFNSARRIAKSVDSSVEI
jgi:DNA-binding GntR family transcriptional regulator